MKASSRGFITFLSGLVITCVIIACGSSSDDDIQTYGLEGDEEFFSLARLADGGYLLGGNAEDEANGPFSPVSGGVPNYYLVRTDDNGDVIWEKTWGDTNRDFITKVTQTDAGDLIVAGNAQLDDNTYEGQLIKLDSNGNVIWAVVLDADGNEIIWDMKELSEGSILVVGGLFDPITFASDTIISKYTSTGELVWQRIYGEESNELMLDVLEVSDGGFVAVGNKVTDNNTDMVFWRLDSNGALLYQKEYGGTGYESASGIVAADGGFLVSGTAVMGGTNDITLIRTDTTGEIIWQKYFGDEENDTGSEAVATSDGGFVVVGTDKLNENDTRIILLKVDSAGNQIWEKSYGDSGLNYGSEIVNTANGFAVSGYGDSEGNGGLDGYLLLLDEEGDFI